MNQSIERGLGNFFAWIPQFIGAVVILVVGHFIGKAVQGLVSGGLEQVGFNKALHGGRGGQMVQRAVSSPSQLAGRIAYWAVLLGAISLAVSVLGIPALNSFVTAIYAYLPNVVAAIGIFIVAGLISTAVDGLIARFMGDTPTGKIAMTAVPIVVMGIASFMILDQLKIAPAIVTITYAAVMGALALGSALAFGLGGRNVASRLIEGAVDKGQQSAEDFSEGYERVRSHPATQQMAQSFYEQAGDPGPGQAEQPQPSAENPYRPEDYEG